MDGNYWFWNKYGNMFKMFWLRKFVGLLVDGDGDDAILLYINFY